MAKDTASTQTCEDAVLTVSPFCSPRYQFGMLLGIDDFDVAQAYPRGKVRLHNAWLHREGVVWGFGVSAPEKASPSKGYTGEIRVEPGLALDAAGHELHLDGAACVSVAAWYQKQLDDKNPAVDALQSGKVTVHATVEIRFHACLSRPVPSMSEPCDQGGNGVAYSRACETVEIKLVPRKAEKYERKTRYPYHLLRMLFGLEGAVDPAQPTDGEKAVVAALASVAAAPPAKRAERFLFELRRVAALDVTALGPGKGEDGSVLLFPDADDTPIVLADVKMDLQADAGGVAQLTNIKIDPTVRPSHVATSTIQELNLWPGLGRVVESSGPRVVSATLSPQEAAATATPAAPAAAPAAPVGAPAAPAAPPAAPATSVDSSRRALEIEVVTDGPLDHASFNPGGFTVSYLDEKKWGQATVHATAKDSTTVVLALSGVPSSYRQLRLIAHGTGPTPLLGTNGLPLAGAASDPRAGGESDGIDFVQMWKGR